MYTYLPLFVRQYLQLVPSAPQALALLKLDAQHCVVDSQGELHHYGLSNIDRSRPIVDYFLPLEGLLGVKQSPLVIQFINMPENRYIDMHILYDRTNQWVILNDRTREGRLEQHAQQLQLLNDLDEDAVKFSPKAA